MTACKGYFLLRPYEGSEKLRSEASLSSFPTYTHFGLHKRTGVNVHVSKLINMEVHRAAEADAGTTLG